MGDVGVEDQPSAAQPPHAVGLHGRRCGFSSNMSRLPPLCSLVGDFGVILNGGNICYQSRKGWYSPGSSAWALWRSVVTPVGTLQWAGQQSPVFIGSLRMDFHGLHTGFYMAQGPHVVSTGKNGFFPKRLCAWIYLCSNLHEDINFKISPPKAPGKESGWLEKGFLFSLNLKWKIMFVLPHAKFIRKTWDYNIEQVNGSFVT